MRGHILGGAALVFRNIGVSSKGVKNETPQMMSLFWWGSLQLLTIFSYASKGTWSYDT